MQQFLTIFIIFTFISPVFGLSKTDSLVNVHFKQNEIEKASTARHTKFMTSVEKRSLAYINLARMYPARFAEFYKAYIKEFDTYAYNKFQSKEYYHYSLYTYLKRKKPSKPLLPNQQMQNSAMCWAKESGEKGIIGHQRKLCKTDYRGECCNYSYVKDAMEHIMNLLIDEQVASLGHRKILLSTNYSVIGISYHAHKKYNYCSVYDLR